MTDITEGQLGRDLARRLERALSELPDRDPVDVRLLPGGELDNHGIDAELTGLRAAAADAADGELVLRGVGGSGWCVDAVGQRELYPRVGEVVCRCPIELITADEHATATAWADEGVPLRLRGLVGATPRVVLDDGWRTVVLARPAVTWTITAA